MEQVENIVGEPIQENDPTSSKKYVDFSNCNVVSLSKNVINMMHFFQTWSMWSLWIKWGKVYVPPLWG